MAAITHRLRYEMLQARRLMASDLFDTTGTREPAFRWNDSGLFLHGLQVGVDYNF